MPLAASPEFPPDTLWLYLEPDFVLTIDHSIRQAIDIHNQEQRRQKNAANAHYSEEEVAAYAKLYKSWLISRKWHEQQASRHDAAWPTWIDVDPETRKAMEFL